MAIEHIPLFPLNTVLFPGVPIYLHIFEERYKQMIRLCIEDRLSFGVVLIRQGVEVGGSAESHTTGCTAQIIQVERLAEGRMNLAAIGQRRFRVRNLSYDRPYLMGEVDTVPLCVDAALTELDGARQRLLPWIDRYLDVMRDIRQVRYYREELPEDAAMLAYTAAHVLQVPQSLKQQFLEMNSTLDLLEDVRRQYRREVAFLKAFVEHAPLEQGADQDIPFSLN